MNSLDFVAPGVRRIRLPLPFALSSVNVYLLEGAHAWSLVDSGLHTPGAVAVLDAALAEAGIARGDVKSAFITHFHPDHFGNTGMLRRTGTEILMHGPEADDALDIWGPERAPRRDQQDWLRRHGLDTVSESGMREAGIQVRSFVDSPDRVTRVDDGTTIDLGSRNLTTVWTPGHTDYHTVLVDFADGTLFSGDHVLPRITSNIGWFSYSRRDPLGDFLASLSRVATLPVRLVLPAHGDPLTDLQGRVAEVHEHHRTRLEETAEALARGPRNAWDVTRKLFARLDNPHDRRFALGETLAHLRHLETTMRAVQIEGQPVTWRLA